LILIIPAWSQTISPDPKTEALMNQVSRQNLGTYIQALADANGHRSRTTYTPGNRWAVSYIKQTFESFTGLSSVALDTFVLTDAKPPFNLERLYNVVATLEGKEEPLKIYVIGGHLDCTSNRDNGVNWDSDWLTTNAPGADDNASGLAAIFEIARILSDPNNQFVSNYTLKFVAFGAEEFHPAYPSHHYGSVNFAKKAYAQKQDILGAYILDMIGYNNTGNDYLNIVSNGNSQPLGEQMLAVNSTYQLNLRTNAPPFPTATYSDHESFWIYRYKAILLIENAPPWNNNAPWYTANPHYHTRSDAGATVNLQQVEKVTKLALGTVASLAGLSTAVKDKDAEVGVVPKELALLQNYPNPLRAPVFNAGMQIRYHLPSAGKVSLKIYNLFGQVITELVQKYQEPGEHTVVWKAKDSEGRELSSGIYLAVLEMGNLRSVRKVVFNK
jgi:hypothetical protein